MWSEEFFYCTCLERNLIAVLYTVCNSSSLHVEFPPRWLKYQHIAAIFPPTRGLSFNNLQNEGGRWEAIKVTWFNLWSTAIQKVFLNKEEQFMFSLKSSLERQLTLYQCTLFIQCVYVHCVYCNRYVPRNTICTMFTVWSGGRKITISNLMSFNCSMQS